MFLLYACNYIYPIPHEPTLNILTQADCLAPVYFAVCHRQLPADKRRADDA